MNLDLYRSHLESLQTQWEAILIENELDAVVLPAGVNQTYFDDDQNPPFHANPYFLRWVPENDCEHSIVVVGVNETPKVFWYSPDDYWYLPSTAPEWLQESLDCSTYGETEKQLAAVVSQLGQKRNAVIGPNRRLLDNIANVQEPSQKLLNQLAFGRACKSEFEIDCIERATEIGVRGHLAARATFRNGGSEFDIHMAYLNASEQLAHELPYQNIVALNNHCATMHYQHYDRVTPDPLNSLLIDAGGKYCGYHSDITRTYSTDEGNEFAELVERLDEQQQLLTSSIHKGMDYVTLHEKAHKIAAAVLSDCSIVNCSAQSCLDQGLTRTFFPHGVGHLLGLQTHDVGGNVVDRSGTEGNPPKAHPKLRMLRTLDVNYVFTVEPGIYFIPTLLNQIRGHKDINWSKVERLIPFGGVRIEDDIQVLENGVRNLTREAFFNLENHSLPESVTT